MMSANFCLNFFIIIIINIYYYLKKRNLSRKLLMFIYFRFLNDIVNATDMTLHDYKLDIFQWVLNDKQ